MEYPLYDDEIRPILFDHYECSGERLRIFEEFNIGKCRADAFMVSDTFTGFEIKSDMDSLVRLPNQIKYYNKYCNYNYLVTGNRYMSHAQQILPEWWGIFVATQEENGKMHLECVRKAEYNKKVKLKFQLSLLWRPELISIVRKYKLGGVTTRNKVQLRDLILAKLPEDTIMQEMCAQLMEREYSLNQE